MKYAVKETQACSYSDFGDCCRRPAEYRLIGVRGWRGMYCRRHAEKGLGRPLTSDEMAGKEK